jgi:hypothetical protein
VALKAPKLDNLDDLHFQQLVDEARRRIPLYCSDWTDFNLSDPGITLVELFAWMTELLAYRINQVPEKNYVKFLEMLGIQLQPARPARADLTFRLSTPFPLRVNEPDDGLYTFIRQGTKISNGLAADSTNELVFTTDEPLIIHSPLLCYFFNGQWQSIEALNRSDKGVIAFGPSWDAKSKKGSFQLAFDAAHDISGHVLRLNIECDENRGTGIRRDQPPLQWSCFAGKKNDQELWLAVEPGKIGDDRDSTGGFNNPKGHLTLFLPPKLETQQLSTTGDKNSGMAVYLVRCEYIWQENNPLNQYNNSPIIKRMTAQTVGATVAATNAVCVLEEVLGISSGEPGQCFAVANQPMVTLPKHSRQIRLSAVERFIHPEFRVRDEDDLGKTEPIAEKTALTLQEQFLTYVPPIEAYEEDVEIVEIEESHNGEIKFQRWHAVDEFTHSSPHDRHYILDRAAGEIQLGPAIQASDGILRQYGRVPAVDRRIRIRRYWHSGGSKGNLGAEKINILHEAFPYVDSVKNLKSAFGGRDVETLGAAKERAKQLMRVQRRAVTAADYERLARSADERTVRVKCLPPVASDSLLPRLRLLVIPAGAVDIRLDTLEKLSLDYTRNEGLREALYTYLDDYRIVTTAIEVCEPRYIAIWLQIKLLASQAVDPPQLQRTVQRLLCWFIAPYYQHEQSASAEAESPSDDAAQQRIGLVSLLPEAWEGWPFGRTLSKAELLAMIQKVPGVDYVEEIKIFYRPLTKLINLTAAEEAQLNAPKSWLEQRGNLFSGLTADSLLCTIHDHEIKIEVTQRD